MVQYQLFINGTQRDFNSLSVSWNIDNTDIPVWEAELSFADESVTREDAVEIKRKGDGDASFVTIFKGILEWFKPAMSNSGDRTKQAGGRHTTVKLWRKWAERNNSSPAYWSDYYPDKILTFLTRSIRSDKPQLIEETKYTRIGWGKYSNGEFVATASSSQSGYEPYRALDQYPAMIWRSNANQNGAWLKIDLGASYTIAGVKIDSWYSTNYFRGYILATSTDGSSWTTRATQTTNKARNIVESWTPTSVRYIRITGTVTTSIPADVSDVYIFEGSAISGISTGTLGTALPFNCSEITTNQSSGDYHVHCRHSHKFQVNDEVIVFDGSGNEKANVVSDIDGTTDQITLESTVGLTINTGNSPWIANFTHTHAPQVNFDYKRRTDAMDIIVKNCLKSDDKTWDWWVTDDGALYFDEERGSDLSGSINFQYAIHLEDTEHSLDNTNKADSILVLGKKNGKDENLQDANSSGWVGTGDYEFVTVDEEADSEAASASKAYELLAASLIDTDKLKFDVDDIFATNSWGLGDYVTVTDSGTGVSGSYRVMSIKRKYNEDGEKVQISGSSTRFTIGRAIERIFREAKSNSMHMDSTEYGPGTNTPGFYLFYEAEKLAFDASVTVKQPDTTSSGGAHLITNSDKTSTYQFSGPGVTLKAGNYKCSFYLKVGDNSSGSQIAGLSLYSPTKGANFGELAVLASDFTASNTWQELSFAAIVDAEYSDVEFRCYFYGSVTDLYADWCGLRGEAMEQIEDYMDNPVGPPAAPTGLIAADNPLSVRLTWAANTEFDLDHYNIYRNTVNTFATSTKVAEVDANAYIWAATTAQYNILCYFWVTAVDWIGQESTESTSDSATPLYVDTVELAPDSITADQIQDDAVTEAAIADLAIANNHIQLLSIDADNIISNALTALQLKKGVQPYISDIEFTPKVGDTHDSITYTTGTVYFADGTTQSITGTNFNNLSNGFHYLYFEVGSTGLSESSTYSNAVSDTKGLLAIAKVSTDTTQEVFIYPFYSKGLNINADAIAALSINTDALQADSIVAGKIAANAIEAVHITAGSIETLKLAANAVEADKIAANAVTAGKIAAGEVYTRHLVVFQVLLDADPFSAAGGTLSWVSHKLQYEGVQYTIAASSTTYKYITWNVGDSAYTKSDTKPDLADYDIHPIVVFSSSSNTWWEVWKPTVVHGGMIVAETISAEEITADWITGKQFRTTGRLTPAAGIEFSDTALIGYSGATAKSIELLSTTGVMNIYGEGSLTFKKADGTSVGFVDSTVYNIGGTNYDGVRIYTGSGDVTILEGNGSTIKVGHASGEIELNSGGYDTKFASNIMPSSASDLDIGDATTHHSAIYSDDFYGMVHYDDLYLSDLTCPKCGKRFKRGDELIFIVKDFNVDSIKGEEMATIPAHRRCNILDSIRYRLKKNGLLR